MGNLPKHKDTTIFYDFNRHHGLYNLNYIKNIALPDKISLPGILDVP
jgi:hypothetical protein